LPELSFVAGHVHPFMTTV